MPFVAFGQLPLDSAVALALQKNLNIQVQRKNLEASDENYNPGVAGFYPVLSAGGTYSYSQGDFTQQLQNETQERTINGAVSEGYNADVTLSYTLFDGLGNVHNYRKLALQRDLTATQLRFTIENTLLQVYAAYFETARLKQQLTVAAEAVALSLDRYARAEISMELGVNTRLQNLSARVDLNTDSLNLMNAQADYNKSVRNLNQALNLPIDGNIEVDTVVTLSKTIDYAALRQSALRNNAALVQAQFSREIVQKNVRIAYSAFSPQVTAQGGYQYTRQENEGSFLQFTQNTGWQGSVSARWTIFNGNRTKTNIEIAKINLEKSELELAQSKQQLEVDLANAYIDYQNSKRTLSLENRNLEVSQLNFTRTQEAYKLGQVNNTQLREAQINYISAKARYNNLRYNLKLTEVELLRVAGELVGE